MGRGNRGNASDEGTQSSGEDEPTQQKKTTKLPRPEGKYPCPRCASENTKFCYYNNYNIKQPRFYCKVRAFQGKAGVLIHSQVSVRSVLLRKSHIRPAEHARTLAPHTISKGIGLICRSLGIGFIACMCTLHVHCTKYFNRFHMGGCPEAKAHACLTCCITLISDEGGGQQCSGWRFTC